MKNMDTSAELDARFAAYLQDPSTEVPHFTSWHRQALRSRGRSATPWPAPTAEDIKEANPILGLRRAAQSAADGASTEEIRLGPPEPWQLPEIIQTAP